MPEATDLLEFKKQDTKGIFLSEGAVFNRTLSDRQSTHCTIKKKKRKLTV